MIDPYQALKWIHILSSTILFGTGMGTAFHMWMAHRRGDARTIATVAANVVLADWLFTLTSGIVQPVTGLAMVFMAGFSPWESWLVVSYALYLLALACWVPVVVLQMRARNLAVAAAAHGAPLPARYHRIMWQWFALGWPAFIALIVIFGLMVVKPILW
ncbi:MAG TPA: DUF2269 domain-containing protein [Vineibacter sp.]|nr:DUF2269 domain-containing protein [Vineibacter sp.]